MADLAPQIKKWRRQLVATERELEEVVAEMRAIYEKLGSLQERVDTADARREALGDLIAGAEKLAALDRPSTSGGIVLDGTVDPPRGRDAVRRVLQDGGPRIWRPADIVQAVIDKGWVDPAAKNPAASIRVATRRLQLDGELEKVGSGYRLKRFPGVTLPGLAARPAGEPESANGNGEA